MKKIDMIKKQFKKYITSTSLFHLYDQFRRRERKRSLGEDNPNKIFYVIGFDDTTGGVFWLVNKMLMHLAYALDKGYIAVVDYKNHRTQYTGEEELGKVNIWEKYFKQPMGFSVEDIAHSKNVIYGKLDASPDKEHFMGNFYDDKQWIQYFRNLFHKYVYFSDSVYDYLKDSEKLLGEGRILGVLCRGTDYIVSKPQGHPKPPTPAQVIEKSKEVMKEYQCTKIFLATEDEDVYVEFKNVFGNNLVVNPQTRISKSQLSEGHLLSYTKMQVAKTIDERFKSGLEYLDAIYLLSKCNCFVGVRCGGSKGALILTEGFEYEYLFDMGMYK